MFGTETGADTGSGATGSGGLSILLILTLGVALGGESDGTVVDALKPLDTCGLNFSAWVRALCAGSPMPRPGTAFSGEANVGGGDG